MYPWKTTRATGDFTCRCQYGIASEESRHSPQDTQRSPLTLAPSDAKNFCESVDWPPGLVRGNGWPHGEESEIEPGHKNKNEKTECSVGGNGSGDGSVRWRIQGNQRQ